MISTRRRMMQTYGMMNHVPTRTPSIHPIIPLRRTTWRFFSVSPSRVSTTPAPPLKSVRNSDKPSRVVSASSPKPAEVLPPTTSQRVLSTTLRLTKTASIASWKFLSSPSVIQAAKTAGKKVVEVIVGTGRLTWAFIKHPPIVKQWANDGWIMLKGFLHHTWMGFKLLALETRTSFKLASKRISGHQLTRRERRQLIRTTSDLARMVPFMFFLIIPFMEFLLPVALKIFPNMLPSTFQDEYKREEDMKRKLKLRIEMATFLQDMVVEMEDKVKAKARNAEDSSITADDVQLFMEKTRMGAYIPDETLLKVAKLFSDELTTDNMSRSQLLTLCKYMGLPTYGGDNFLRFQMRSKLNSIREDDSQIFFEGVESLNLLELKQACQDRGMRATGLSMHQYRVQLKRWVELSVRKDVPLSLLILSRTFTLQSSHNKQVEVQAAISDALSKMDEKVLHNALLEGALSKDIDADASTLSRFKLEAIVAQNDMIDQEIKEKQRKRAFLEKLKKQAQDELADARMTPVDAVSIEKEITMEPPMVDKAKAIILEDADDHEDDAKDIEEKLESIKVLASMDPLQEERSVLESLLEKQEEFAAAKAVQSGRILRTTEEGVAVGMETLEPEKRVQSMLKKKITSMVEKLELDVVQTDEMIREKFKVLDLDNDGKISTAELREAIINALKKNDDKTKNVNQVADRLIATIDLDQDGIISLKEMDTILQKLKEERKLSEGE